MTNIPVKKDIMLLDGKRIIIDVDFPIDGPITVDEEGYEHGIELLMCQYYNAVKRAIEAYNNSDLPTRFIEAQKFIVTDLSFAGPGNLGLYDRQSDTIFFAPNAISGIGCNGEFLMGHEVGHKIERYKLIDEETKEEIRSILGLCSFNEHIIKETFADACGDIVYNKQDSYHQFLPDDEKRREKLKNLVLKTSYRC